MSKTRDKKNKKRRGHDAESKKIASEHDKVKEQNRLERKRKEKARLAKYEKPWLDKKDSHELQMKLHELVFDVPVSKRNNRWRKDIKQIKKVCVELGIWDGFVQKMQLNNQGID